MFGFRFPENFRWPYVATSVQDFWRRWHLSLSTWFRDYLYIPLGGNRVPTARQYRNLVTGILSVRPLARRQLELRDLGPLARRVPGR
jgi:alginate O-acetyltransferase complex protein AlgI